MRSVRVFEELYERYDKWYEEHPILAANELEAVRAVLATIGSRRDPCLEVGVGSGWFASRVGCIGGVDPSLRMLAIARRRGLEAVAGRGEALPIASSTIRVLLLIVTLCFVDDPGVVVKESARALQPGGSLVSCIVPRNSSWGLYYMRMAREGHPFYSVAKFYTVEEIDELARQSGLEVASRAATLSFPPRVTPAPERPHEYTGREGFVCTRYAKMTVLE